MTQPRSHPRRLPTHLAAVACGFVVLAASAFVGALIEDGPVGADTATTQHRADAAPAVAPASTTAGPSNASPTPAAPGTATPIATSPRPAVPVSTLAADGIPTTALAAYRRAARDANERYSTCGIAWPMVAAIGRVESDHGRFGGAVLHVDGVSTPGIVGVPLDGTGTEVIRDTDHGKLDGDTVYDRAVGPMQFIPSTWATWRVDADHDGKADPNDIDDAAAATAAYLCASGGDLRTYPGQRRAVLAYNHSTAYLRTVLGLEKIYARGVVTVPTAPGHGDARIPPVKHPAPSATAPTAVTVTRPGAPGPSRSGTRPAPSCTPGSTGATTTTSKTPTASPTTSPTPTPTAPLTATPTASPTPSPTPTPSTSPTKTPSKTPTKTPSKTPPPTCR